MKELFRGVVLATAFLALACGGDDDADETGACTIENCQAALVCGAGVRAGALEVCGAIPVDERPGDDGYLAYCVEACRAGSEGRTFACFAKQADECRAAMESRPPDVERLNAARISCVEESARVVGPQCVAQCNAAYEACTEQCSLESWETCAPCANECGVAMHGCTAACER